MFTTFRKQRFAKSEELIDDRDKIRFLCRHANVDIAKGDIVSVRRIGKKTSDKNRLLKIELKNTDQKFKFLNKRKDIIRNQDIQNCFQNKIFVNPDNSYLMQCEEHRLRQKLKEIKEEEPGVTCYIRSGLLYRSGSIIDKVNVCNQLF